MRRRNENGEVVVEATIVVTIVALFITVMFYIGMILYQQSLVSIMANHTASNIAQVYSNSIKDPFTGYVDPDSVYQSVTYVSMKDDAYRDVLKQKANVLALYRLKSAGIVNTGETSVDVNIVKKQNELLKSQIVVTVEDKYELPLVSFFGVDNKITFSASGRADCVDIIEYVNGVEAIGDPEKSNVTHIDTLTPEICTLRFYDNRRDLVLIATVPVLKGNNILTSNEYTHCVLPHDPQNAGFRFAGWVTEDGEEFTASTEVRKSMSIYGTWYCRITFEPEGGTVTPSTMDVLRWTTAKLPVPQRKGYIFSGWFTEKNGAGTQYFSNSSFIEDNLTLYANWVCDHDYKLISATEATCLEKTVETYRCVNCGDEYTKEGDNGPHQFGPWEQVATATCVQRSRFERVCKICGFVDPKEGDLGDHSIEARCGVTHYYSIKLSSHNLRNGYTKTTSYQCMVCEYCGAPYKDKWVWVNNNFKRSYGVYCWSHNDNSGDNRRDMGGSLHYDWNPVYYVH